MSQIERHAEIGSGRLPEMNWKTIVEQIHIERYRFALTHIRGSVLDIACGIGYGSHILGQEGRMVVGVDVSAEAVAQANATFRTEHVSFEKTDGGALPFVNDRFDSIVSFETIEHVDDPKAFLVELRRVLRPGGTLVISTPNKRFHSFGKPSPWNPFHTVEYNPEDFYALLTSIIPVVTFSGGQEFLDCDIRNTLRYNFSEFRYYNFDAHPVVGKFADWLKRWKRKTIGQAKTFGLPPEPALLKHRTEVVPLVQGKEPYTMVLVCKNETTKGV